MDKLKMKRDSFKMLLMTVNTECSKYMYRFLISFENQMKKYSHYQHECEMYKKEMETEKIKCETILSNLEEYIKNAKNKAKSIRIYIKMLQRIAHV